MNSMQRSNSPIPQFAAIFLLLSADFTSKALVQANLSPGESIPLLDDVLRVTYVQNCSGFSWFVPHLPAWVGVGFQILLFLAAIAAFPVYWFYTSTRRRTLWTDVAFICVAASFLGHSVIDLFFPCTVDFLQVLHSPSANLADLYSYIGIGALLIETAQIVSTEEFRKKSLRSHIAEMANTRKEFFDFIRKNLGGR